MICNNSGEGRLFSTCILHGHENAPNSPKKLAIFSCIALIVGIVLITLGAKAVCGPIGSPGFISSITLGSIIFFPGLFLSTVAVRAAKNDLINFGEQNRAFFPFVHEKSKTANPPSPPLQWSEEELYGDNIYHIVEKKTLLHQAAMEGDANKVISLIQHGFDINAVDESVCGYTPLHLAAFYGNLNCVKALVNDPRCVIYKKDKHQSSALHYAAQASEAHNEGVAIIALLVEKGFSIDERNQFGFTPFLQACNKGSQEIVQKFIELGAQVDVKNNDGQTALHLAADQNSSLIPFLLTTEVSHLINRKDNKGNTALHFTVTSVLPGKKESCLALIQAGARINEQNNEGQTALHLAVSEYIFFEPIEGKDFIQTLLQNGADKNILDEEQKRPIDLTNDPSIKQLLSESP